MNGKLILVIGPTGSGKSTLMKHAIALHPAIKHPYSYTTRPRRAEAIENDHYRFLTVEEFTEKIGNNEFLEWAEYGGNYYGTLKSEVLEELAQGTVLLKEMEVQGARQVREILSPEQLLTVFIDAGDWATLEKRVLSREVMSDEQLEQRRRRYEDEVTFKSEADAVIDNTTDDKESAKAQFADLLQSHIYA